MGKIFREPDSVVGNRGKYSLNTMEPVQFTPVAAILKLTEDWKKEGEMGYILTLLQDSREIKHGKRIIQRIQALRQMANKWGQRQYCSAWILSSPIVS